MQQVDPANLGTAILSSSYLKKVGLFFLFSSLALYAFIFAGSNRLRLTLEMASSTPSVAQVFFDTGFGYSEGQSSTAVVTSNSLAYFQSLSFNMPEADIRKLRFDPLTSAGTVVVRDVAVRYGSAVLLRIPASDLLPFNQIAKRVQKGDQVLFSTIPGAGDPGLTFFLHEPIPSKRIIRWRHDTVFLIGVAILLAVSVLLLALREHVYAASRFLSPLLKRIDADFARFAARISSSDFLPLDSYAVWFYFACFALFGGAVAADLNGSSAGMYPASYGHGAEANTWVGTPKGSRADEWAYVTPDILNQSLRLDRFEVTQSELGAHSVALLGNIPVKHVSTFFRPQFWAFFCLPVDYAFAFYWQFKTLILVIGVFTWLLLITRSTFWSITGSLWYFFSPLTQWDFSWPSALPEMIGALCLGTVFACYLTVGRSKVALLLASIALSVCAVEFALCGYPPHMIPLFWVGAFFFIGWCIAKRRNIMTPEAAGLRIAAVCLAIVIIAGLGFVVYRDLHQALIGIADTIYPGRRVDNGGRRPFYYLLSHFMQWTETETRMPQVLGNMCEGSGFLWLAPLALVCSRRLKLSRFQTFAMASLWLSFSVLLAWYCLPIPAKFGAILGLNRTMEARILNGAGLANIAIVVLCGACLTQNGFTAKKRWIRWAAPAIGFAILFFALRYTDRKLDSFFSTRQVLIFAAITTALVFLFLSRRKWAFALALLLPQAIIFGPVNPVVRGVSVFTGSSLRHFVQQNPSLLKGKWIDFSDSVVNSGFLAATGCEVYTGTHYLPDIDHWGLFRANHLDINLLDRLGYLDAHLRRPNEPMKLELLQTVVVQWDVSPADEILKQLGIRYAAFDQPLDSYWSSFVVPLSSGPIDGFWLYRLR